MPVEIAGLDPAELRQPAGGLTPGRRNPVAALPDAASVAVVSLPVPDLPASRCASVQQQERLARICATPNSLVAACRAGEGAGCADLADCHTEQWRRPESLRRAVALYRAGCDGQSARGCLQTGRLLARGQGVRKDLRAALRHFDRACQLGAAEGCAAAGTLRYLGKGAPADRDRAAHLFDRACKGGAGLGCLRLGVLYARGEDKALIGRDVSRALRLYERGCTLCDGQACLLAAQRLADEPTAVERSTAWRAEACRLGVAAACAPMAR